MRDSTPTRRERAYLWLRNALPPHGRDAVNLRGIGVLLAVLVVLLSAVATAAGEARLIPSIVGAAGVVFALFVAYDIFNV